MKQTIKNHLKKITILAMVFLTASSTVLTGSVGFLMTGGNYYTGNLEGGNSDICTFADGNSINRIFAVGDTYSVYAASAVSADSVKATARINAEDGVYLRKGAGTGYKDIKIIADNAKVTILKEVFTTDTKTSKKYKWYYVSAAGTKGYVRSDCVDSISYPEISAVTTEEINFRSGPAMTMKIKGVVKKGASVTVRLKAVRKGNSQKWYRVLYKGTTCYMCADFIKLKSVSANSGSSTGDTSGKTNSSSNSSTSTTKTSASTSKTSAAKTTAAKEPVIKLKNISKPETLTTGQGFSLTGTITCDQVITKVVTGITNTSGKWLVKYKSTVKANTYDMQEADPFVKFGTLRSGKYRYRIDVYVNGERYTKVKKTYKVVPCEVAEKLMKKATKGGKARYVYTFNTSNCSKVFSVRGYNDGIIPQGLAYTGSKYYVLYGMESAQAIVTYSTDGERLDAVEFPENTGHANGIAWVPKKEQCYIFRGYNYTCISWKPSNNKFKFVDIPHSSSGVSYDKSKDLICVSSKTHIRIYSSDGKFTQLDSFGRCTRSNKSYVQDCGAARGYVFHGVSSDENYKHGTNYLDVYRISDKKYLGSIKVKIDEIEGVIINNEGFVELLCNDVSRTDYIWRTPLNVYDLP